MKDYIITESMFRNINNDKKVASILQKLWKTDFYFNNEKRYTAVEAAKELRDIGEDIIADKICPREK